MITQSQITPCTQSIMIQEEVRQAEQDKQYVRL